MPQNIIINKMYAKYYRKSDLNTLMRLHLTAGYGAVIWRERPGDMPVPAHNIRFGKVTEILWVKCTNLANIGHVTD